MRPAAFRLPARTRRARGRQAYTLVEIMLVVVIMGMVLAMGVPSFLHTVHRRPMLEAVHDLQEACRSARLLAIMQGRTTEVLIKAGDGSVQVQVAPDPRQVEPDPTGQGDPEGSADASSDAAAPDTPAPAGAPPGFSAKMPDSVTFKTLMINRRDMMDDDHARVHFYPNGTCDSLSATLYSEQNEERTFKLEITTGRDSVVVVR